ncbi:MAG: pur operon repressor [Bacillota bacterium]|jgi:purine operon repressor|nr:pur operon repressor [Bacillota bacterium]HHT89848.1 pur operon repressor [Bacillota bacterium]
MRRAHRIAAITKTLVERPHHVFGLGEFADLFEVARSTLSEDLAIIRSTFEALEMGLVETIAGAVGGVRYLPLLNKEQIRSHLEEVCERLREPERILPGGFLFIDDLLTSPPLLQKVGYIFATKFRSQQPEHVVTVETAGISVAFQVAQALDIPLVIVRRQSKPTEGPVLTMNFISGSDRQIETMSLSRRALKPGNRVLLIDDFMKAGGTLRGLTDLMGEFGCTVVGKGVLIETNWPEEKLISDHLPLVYLEEVATREAKVVVRPADWVYREE